MNTIEHIRTLLNAYFQGQQILMMQMPVELRVIPSTSRIQTRGKTASSTTGVRLMVKKYKCQKCDHELFTTKYGLAQHIKVKYEEKGVKCDIWDKSMASHNLDGHMNIHAISYKFTCEEKLKKTGAKCERDFKQKLGIVRHLKEIHTKSYAVAKVKVLEKSEMEFEMREDYELYHGEKSMEREPEEQMVDEYGEVVMLV